MYRPSLEAQNLMPNVAVARDSCLKKGYLSCQKRMSKFMDILQEWLLQQAIFDNEKYGKQRYFLYINRAQDIESLA